MKTDTYLNLCLEQAELSPLHHRHGCIVVKGGKVIGKGFNDYRSGFDGGALKTGVLPSKSFALDKLKLDKLKLKPKGKDDGGFKPFESIFNETHRPNYVLSMHSEMMAINSALATSSTLAATTIPSPVRPALGRKTSDALARLPGPGGVLNLPHIDATRQYHGPQTQNLHHYHGAKGKKQRKQQQQEQRQHESYYQHDSYDAKYNTFHFNDEQTERPKTSTVDDKRSDDGAGDNTLPRQGKSSRRGISSTAKVQNKNGGGAHRPDSSPAVHNLSDRMKNLKLVGADVYIARLGNIQHQLKKRTKKDGKTITLYDPSASVEDTCCSSIPLEKSTSPSGSLHDELKCKDRKSPSPTEGLSDNAADPGFDRRQLRDSRPCYRCVAYMHSAGIRRCFWTNNEGEWENAKVRDLFDQLLGTGSFDGDGDDSPGGVFITKHEVLMMRRQAGEGK